MVSNLFFYQVVLIALVWLFLLLSWLWPSEPTTVPPSPSKPVPPPRQRSKKLQPCPGLTSKARCEACEQALETSMLAPPSAPPPKITSTRGRRRHVATSQHFFPKPASPLAGC